MHELLQRLGRGDARILDMCARSHAAWVDLLEELRTADTGTLSARLGFFQPVIEKIFDSRGLGQTMMPWTAFAALYDTENSWGGNEQRALELVVAFANSNCSEEVKSEARSAVISYGLDKHPDFAALAGASQRFKAR